MSTRRTSGFDRVRPRRPEAEQGSVRTPQFPADVDGTRALFSSGPARSVPGWLRLTCSACGRTSLLSPVRALRAAVPSLHLPLLRRRYPSWMRCPACGRRTWVRLGLRS